VKEFEGSAVDPAAIRKMSALVSGGESLHLEFKRKAAFPDKIVKEVIAFANTQGGTLLIGVDDDGTLQGLRYPEEEALVLRKAIQKHCRPSLAYDEFFVPLNAKKSILRFDIPVSPRRPHHFRVSSRVRETYIRVKDMSMKASREMIEIVRLGKQNKNIQFTYGAHEGALMRYLDDHPSITLKEFQSLSGLDPLVASRKLVTLVLANVIRITPTEKGDLYSRK
jgi:predicted HTH transcriptional regulator